MKKIYASVVCKAFAFCLSFCLLTSLAVGQSLCGPIVENFNNPAAGTAGFIGDFSYNNQKLQKSGVTALAVYSITSPTYQLPSTATSLGYGFILDGTEQVARAEVFVQYVPTGATQIQSFSLAIIIPNYGNSSQATICSATDLSTLTNFPADRRYRIAIQLTSNTGVGTSTQTISFDDFRTNGSVAAIPLPVNFIGFDAKKEAGGVRLTWKVAGEENVNRYEVERSTDGRIFTTLARVPTSKHDVYTYVDASAGSTAYYRIKNVDNDGKFKYSGIARIANGVSSIVITAFPQPVVSRLTLQHPSIRTGALITVSTADGRVVSTVKPVAGSMQTYLDMSKLQKGLYVVRLTDGDGAAETLKVVKQ